MTMPTPHFAPPDPSAPFRRVLEADENLLARAERHEPAQAPTEERPANSDTNREWPKALADQAFHGIAGKIVRAIEPHTEADPAALLFQFLVGFGSLVGREPHTAPHASREGDNLFSTSVGVSSKGRKDPNRNHVRPALEAIGAEWASLRIQGGLSEGEGLIWAVHDPIAR